MNHLDIVADKYKTAFLEEEKRGFPLKSKRYNIECLRDLYTDTSEARVKNKPVAWISIATPVEIFYAMDIIPFGVEQFSLQTLAALIRKNIGYEFFDMGEAYGIPKEACSAHLATVGMASAKYLPAPDVVVCAAPPCDSSTGMFDVLSNMFNIPSYFLDSSYRMDEDALDYLKKEYEGLIEFLEKNTGRKMDYKRLLETVRLSKEADDYSLEIQEKFRKLAPCPVNAKDVLSADITKMMCSGRPNLTRLWQALYDEITERIGRGEGVIPEERHRLIWMFTYPFHSMKILDWIQEEHKTVSVLDTTNVLPQETMDISDPIKAIGMRVMKVPSIRLSREHWGDMSERGAGKVIPQRCREHNVDSSLFFASWSCQQSALLNRLYKDAMNTIDIPTLVLDGDHYDARIVSMDEMKEKINEYFRVLEG